MNIQYDSSIRNFRLSNSDDNGAWSESIDVNDLCKGQGPNTVNSVVDAVGGMLRDAPYWFTMRVLREVMRDPDDGS